MWQEDSLKMDVRAAFMQSWMDAASVDCPDERAGRDRATAAVDFLSLFITNCERILGFGKCTNRETQGVNCAQYTTRTF